ncbi:MAG TPA: hypothetical protein VNA89_05270 [Gemmatimonadaceae bacterium]|nr:hypothetical protein [Gemmatimonadaceae bacterium]
MTDQNHDATDPVVPPAPDAPAPPRFAMRFAMRFPKGFSLRLPEGFAGRFDARMAVIAAAVVAGVVLFGLASYSVAGAISRARAASAEAAQQQRLAQRLAAQKDSLTGVILEADNFIAQIDSQVALVKGLPRGRRDTSAFESPIAEQIQARKDMLHRVSALVERTQQTAAALEASRRRERTLRGQVDSLERQAEKDRQLIDQLGRTIQRKTVMIAELQTRVDSVVTELNTARAMFSKAYYVIGREDDLVEKGVVVREGGANLLIVHPGRTLQPARQLDRDVFTAIDAREVREIAVPDTTRRYQVVSRQNLDNAVVAERDRASFRGHLKIANVEQFWAPSRFLIIVER